MHAMGIKIIVMGIKRFKKFRQFLHVNDNLKTDKLRLYKVKPVLEAVREYCLKTEPENFRSIDEQIVPAKIKYSGIRQYNPKKLTKWGLKNCFRTGENGKTFNFFLFTVAKSADTEKCIAKSTVLSVSESIPKHNNYYLYFDNWFSTLDFRLKLKLIGILATAPFRSNRIGSCPLETEAELKREGRGSSYYRTDQNSGLHLVKWFENKCVTKGLINLSVKVNDTVKR